MRKLFGILSAFLLLTGSASGAAIGTTAPEKTVAPATEQGQPASAIPVGLTTDASSLARGQIAECANLAALRALDAKAAGSGDDIQRRVLSVSFVLCLAEQGNAAIR